tara:strand:- start:407 stop:724 length:318 start_codon:yes stop_codon:yes gene_type:complete
MTKLASYENNSIISSVTSLKAVHVNADISNKELKTKWKKLNSKLWSNEKGFLVENASYVAYGKSVREFYIYRNQECYSRGLFFNSHVNLRGAQLAAEAFKAERTI